MTIVRPSTPAILHAMRLACVALAGFIFVAAALAACSTTEGFGKDVKSLGGGIEDSAARNK